MKTEVQRGACVAVVTLSLAAAGAADVHGAVEWTHPPPAAHTSITQPVPPVAGATLAAAAFVQPPTV